MRLSLGLETRQTQQLVQKLAPRMIQSMEILQLPTMALLEKIDQALNENPALELEEFEPELAEDGPPEAEAADQESPDSPTGRGTRRRRASGNADDFERLLELDREVPDYFDEFPRRSVNRMEAESDRKHDEMANLESRPQSLQDFLLMQLGEMDLDAELVEIAERIISCLDPSDGGYFRTSLEDLLPADATPEQLQTARRALEIIQSLEPLGVAARDLRECLLVQLRPELPYYEVQKTLIQDHLEDLRDNRLPAIKRRTGYSIEAIQAAWNELRAQSCRLRTSPIPPFLRSPPM
jgi:RNA polymerase sigma-54 factor